jgi:hypothetical protein
MNPLNRRAWVSLFVVIALLLFLPAGTIHCWQAWVYLGIYFTASALITVDLMRHDPELLRRRMGGGPMAEKRRSQRIIMSLASLSFIGTPLALGSCWG